MDRAAPITHALLRIVAGLLFMMHGGQKLFGWFAEGGGMGALSPQMMIAGWLELIGGILVMIGLVTRPVAFLLAGEMAFAYFMAHLPQGVWPLENRGEPAALFCFIFLFLAGNGAGIWSVDSALARRRHHPELRHATAH